MSRMLKNIKVKGGNLRFEHNSARSGCLYTSDSVEVISYYNKAVYFHASSSGVKQGAVQIYNASEQDFEVLKKLLSASPKFVNCGKKFIFSVDNVVDFVNNEDSLNVYCKNKSYRVFKTSEEEVKDFVETMQSVLHDEDSVTND